MLNFDKPSRIFPCILLTRNHMIFLVQFGINKHLLIFSKTTNFVSLWKNLLVLIYSKLHSKSCDYLYKWRGNISRSQRSRFQSSFPACKGLGECERKRVFAEICVKLLSASDHQFVTSPSIICEMHIKIRQASMVNFYFVTRNASNLIQITNYTAVYLFMHNGLFPSFSGR